MRMVLQSRASTPKQRASFDKHAEEARALLQQSLVDEWMQQSLVDEWMGMSA